MSLLPSAAGRGPVRLDPIPPGSSEWRLRRLVVPEGGPANV